MIRSKLCSRWMAVIISLFHLVVGSANASGIDLATPLESTEHDGFVHPQQPSSSNVLDTRQLRGSPLSPTQISPTSSKRRALQGVDGSDGEAIIFILFLFGSTSGEFTSWSLSEHGDGTAPRTIKSVPAGKYLAATDTTELLQLQPGKYYDFSVTNGSSDDSSIDYTIVLSEPAFPVGSGQVLSGSSEVITFYLPTESEVLANPTTVPTVSSPNDVQCAERGQSCLVGSDCCSNRCSPELECSPVAEESDRDKLTEGDVGAFEDSSSTSTP